MGGLITYVDTRPRWDDAGITAMAIFLTCGLLGAAGPRRPWLWALAVGLWLPLIDIAVHHRAGAILALLFAFAGAYAGMGLRRAMAPVRPTLET